MFAGVRLPNTILRTLTASAHVHTRARAHTHSTDVAGGTRSAFPSLDTLIPDVPRVSTVSLLPRMSLLATWSNDTGFASLTLERAHVQST